MADVGFDSDKHAQTRDDMKRGGESLGDSSKALEQLIDAQDPAYWSDEGGFQAMRTVIVACMKTEHRLINRQQTRFSKFDKDVEYAAEAFEAAESANADELAAIMAALERGEAVGAATSGSSTASSGGSGNTGTGTAPTQNKPSEI